MGIKTQHNLLTEGLSRYSDLACDNVSEEAARWQILRVEIEVVI